ncbi:uncharacterized protein LOC132608310 [Lycium barbarum]|uniref:uncharacterized protein LOC132608310 n=1 Tax=Lycium barbarum TaxID=112863 RepID=UPI00293EF5D0|nr:uncharacterized protein LOC132608310 [Lycium barbarum]
MADAWGATVSGGAGMAGEERECERGVAEMVVSGRKINLRKCEIMPNGEVENVKALAQLLNYKVGPLPTPYLGIPLGASNKDKAASNPMIERVEKILPGWQKRYLSKGGKEVLIKSMFSSIPTYFMSLLQAHVGVTEKLEKLQRDFLWNDSRGGKEASLSGLEVCNHTKMLGWP